ncbi:MAG: peptidylprolyl isomerase [Elusimicrobiota bacterium]|nr:peptidylprolyl isomerase [Elusimicrobiota bacterium]
MNRIIKRLFVIIFFAAAAAGCANEEVKQMSRENKSEAEGIYALIRVSRGEENLGKIKIKLFPEKAPVTVSNFTGLAKGEKEYRDPKTGEVKTGRFYDGLIFHRVIKDFMIQGGDPTGTGRGGPGYRFKDEFSEGLDFDRKGILAMANAGPNTNGSQFFITLKPTPWLNNRHTIFGEVVEGMDVVEEIESVETDGADRPVVPVVMDKVEITGGD